MLSFKRNGAPFFWNGCAVFAEYANVAAAEMESGEVEQTRYYMKNAITGEVREMSYDEFIEVTGGKIALPKSQTMPKALVTWWFFTPEKYSDALASAKRVSPTFSGGASSMTISTSVTTTRTATTTKGVSFTGDVWDAIDLKVTGNYNVAKSASSSKSTTISGEFKPKAQYTYNWITFQPRVATITGTLTLKATSDGLPLQDVATYSGVQVKYPVVKNGIHDGHYGQGYTNSSSLVPPLG